MVRNRTEAPTDLTVRQSVPDGARVTAMSPAPGPGGSPGPGSPTEIAWPVRLGPFESTTVTATFTPEKAGPLSGAACAYVGLAGEPVDCSASVWTPVRHRCGGEPGEPVAAVVVAGAGDAAGGRDRPLRPVRLAARRRPDRGAHRPGPGRRRRADRDRPAGRARRAGGGAGLAQTGVGGDGCAAHTRVRLAGPGGHRLARHSVAGEHVRVHRVPVRLRARAAADSGAPRSSA